MAEPGVVCERIVDVSPDGEPDSTTVDVKISLVFFAELIVVIASVCGVDEGGTVVVSLA